VIGVGVLTLGGKTVATEPTLSACDGEGDHDAITAREVLHVAADFFDHAHELVAEHHGLGLWKRAVVDVEIRAADGGGRHADDRVARMFDLGIGLVVDRDVFGRVKNQGLHRSLPC
jgi:hypothetical protein